MLKLINLKLRISQNVSFSLEGFTTTVNNVSPSPLDTLKSSFRSGTIFTTLKWLLNVVKSPFICQAYFFAVVKVFYLAASDVLKLYCSSQNPSYL